MNTSFFPIMGAAIAIIGASVCQAEAASCPENKYNDTKCSSAIFHNQTMTFVNPPNPPPPRRPYPPIPEHEYIMAKDTKITVTPLYGSYSDQGQATPIHLFDQGKAKILLDTSSQPYTTSVKVYGSGSFTLLSDPTNLIYWHCQHSEEFGNMAVDPEQPLSFDVNVSIIYPLDEGACVYLDSTHYSCTCNYEITQNWLYSPKKHEN